LLILSLDEFLRRFLLHVLPKGFVRIPNFGFLANRRRTKLLRKRRPSAVWTKGAYIRMLPDVGTSISVHEGINGHFRAGGD
jgi:hypothetical protein